MLTFFIAFTVFLTIVITEECCPGKNLEDHDD
jgi:hypothetical protein